jgi:hypothetical protein
MFIRSLFWLTLLDLAALGASYPQVANKDLTGTDHNTGLLSFILSPKTDIGNYGFSKNQLGDTANVEGLFAKILDENRSRFPITSKDIKRWNMSIRSDRVTLRYWQAYQGVPVDGTEIGMTVAIGRNSGTIIRFGGRYYRNVHLPSVTPTVSMHQAAEVADNDCQATKGMRAVGSPQLTILPQPSGDSVNFFLAWSLVDFDSVGTPWMYYINGNDGKILKKNRAENDAVGDQRQRHAKPSAGNQGAANSVGPRSPLTGCTIKVLPDDYDLIGSTYWLFPAVVGLYQTWHFTVTGGGNGITVSWNYSGPNLGLSFNSQTQSGWK